jgi:hypothetical protein
MITSRMFQGMVKAQKPYHGMLVKILLGVGLLKYAKDKIIKVLLLITVEYFRITIVRDIL